MSVSNQISLKEIILQIREYIRFILRKWYVLLIALIIGITIAFLYKKYFVKTKYVATCNFVLQNSSKSSSSVIAGFDLGGGENQDVFTGKNLQWLYSTRKMIIKTLLTKVDSNRSELIIDRFIKHDENIQKLISLPPYDKVKFSEYSDLNQLSVDENKILYVAVALINNEYLKVSEVINTESIISVEFISLNEELSKRFVDVIVENVNSYYIKNKIQKLQERVADLQIKSQQYNQQLNSQMMVTAERKDQVPFANPAFQVSTVKPQRSGIDVDLLRQLYTQTMTNLESARIELAQQTPLIQKIDEPEYPLPTKSISSILLYSLSILGTLLLTMTILILIKFYRQVMKTPVTYSIVE